MDESNSRKPTKNNPVTREGYQIPYYPVGDRVVAERIGEDEVKTQAGLIIPPRDKEALSFGTLIAAGLQAMDKLHAMGIKIGDTISWGKWAGIHWDWRPPEDKLNARRVQPSVDVLMVQDILGSAELCDDIMSGAMAIELHEESDGVHRHRLFRAVPEEAHLKETDDGHFVGRPPVPEVEEIEKEMARLRREKAIYHQRQNTAEMDRVDAELNELMKMRARANRGGV